jgi:hypothetical protein
VASAAAGAGLAVVRRLDVVPRGGKTPLFAVHVMVWARRAPCMPAVSHLVVRDESGARTTAFVRLWAAMGMPP